jgi:hypothetical protein
MDWQDAALAAAGVIGSAVAVVHGLLVQRLMVGPIREACSGDKRFRGPVGKLVPALLQFSTFAWFLGGAALVAAAGGMDEAARLAISLFVGALFLFGAVGNLWATRGRHPGGLLMAAAVVLIAVSLAASRG